MKAVVYARYSCDHQREESIEGQLRECKAYAEKNNIMIIGSYIDRAMSAKTDKDDMTVKMYGEEWTHDEFEAFWVAVYKSFGADVTIEMVKDYTGSPHSEEWIRTGGPVFFADCWFQLHWYEKNDMMDTSHRYYIGKGWRSSEGWR